MATFFVVQGRGFFPTDMLRHDCCTPVRAVAGYTAGHQRATLSVADGKLITRDRWSSFGWSVVGEGPSVEAAEAAADERMGPMSNWS